MAINFIILTADICSYIIDNFQLKATVTKYFKSETGNLITSVNYLLLNKAAALKNKDGNNITAELLTLELVNGTKIGNLVSLPYKNL